MLQLFWRISKIILLFFANTDLISEDAYGMEEDEPEIEEIAQKFAHEVEDYEEKNGGLLDNE